MRSYAFVAFFICTYFSCLCQQDSFRALQLDTVRFVQPKKARYKNHSPKVAAILSAALPGAGQIYNRRYWKLPIVWGGLAGLGYLWVNENNRYQDARNSYISLIDTDPTNDIPFNGISNASVVQSTKNVYRNQRDMYLLFGILFYGLSIVDATVDAHFMNFDVSDDLSLKLQLDMRNYAYNAQPLPAVTCTLNFKK